MPARAGDHVQGGVGSCWSARPLFRARHGCARLKTLHRRGGNPAHCDRRASLRNVASGNKFLFKYHMSSFVNTRPARGQGDPATRICRARSGRHVLFRSLCLLSRQQAVQVEGLTPQVELDLRNESSKTTLAIRKFTHQSKLTLVRLSVGRQSKESKARGERSRELPCSPSRSFLGDAGTPEPF